MQYREAEESDITGMAQLRAEEWEAPEYWLGRIQAYLRGESHPQKSLPARAAFVAVQDDVVVGLVAGHRTTRLGCEGELQWINVAMAYRKQGVGTTLLGRMAAWFREQGATRVCVNAEPDNEAAIAFYIRHGARRWNAHWLVWDSMEGVVTNSAEASPPHGEAGHRE